MLAVRAALGPGSGTHLKGPHLGSWLFWQGGGAAAGAALAVVVVAAARRAVLPVTGVPTPEPSLVGGAGSSGEVAPAWTWADGPVVVGLRVVDGDAVRAFSSPLSPSTSPMRKASRATTTAHIKPSNSNRLRRGGAPDGEFGPMSSRCSYI